MIHIGNRHTPIEKHEKRHKGARIIDLTSKATDEFVQFSPFYPHGGIPIPFSEGETGASVEGIWQGLKVFETADIDPACFHNTTMRGLKRTVRKYGRCLGHRRGTKDERLLGYIEARQELYLPLYRWVLDHKLQPLVEQLRQWAQESDLVLLDYETNGVVTDPSSPLSHAHLAKLYIENKYPL